MVLAGDLTVLVPVDISADERPALDVLEFLRPIEVVLLGYFPVPDQAEPAHIKEEYGDEAAARLDAIAAGRSNLHEVLVFTHDREATIDRVAAEHECDAVLRAGAMTGIDRILVPLRSDVNLERIVAVVAGLLAASDATATVFHAAEDTDPRVAESLLRQASDGLVDRGIDPDRVDTWLAEASDAHAEITALGREHDLVVLGETEPSLTERIIGDFLSRVLEETTGPALIVRGGG